ncbi:hypothetical protein KC19_5G093900 [Ceratodon purpureus]|uniref:Uncharacterized protein n=1 Tax=Ceratodon purpureus TaxID=3225 RepID=A0A8T0HZJ5_CERPU|nr:hypothetical protein KC19_5G093900 [Ceratodon purpureus]
MDTSSANPNSSIYPPRMYYVRRYFYWTLAGIIVSIVFLTKKNSTTPSPPAANGTLYTLTISAVPSHPVSKMSQALNTSDVISVDKADGPTSGVLWELITQDSVVEACTRYIKTGSTKLEITTASVWTNNTHATYNLEFFSK